MCDMCDALTSLHIQIILTYETAPKQEMIRSSAIAPAPGRRTSQSNAKQKGLYCFLVRRFLTLIRPLITRHRRHCEPRTSSPFPAVRTEGIANTASYPMPRYTYPESGLGVPEGGAVPGGGGGTGGVSVRGPTSGAVPRVATLCLPLLPATARTPTPSVGVGGPCPHPVVGKA